MSLSLLIISFIAATAAGPFEAAAAVSSTSSASASGRVAPSSSEGAARSEHETSLSARQHAFYGIYMMGAKVGWAEEWTGPLAGEDLLENRMEANISIQRAGITLAMSVKARRTYDSRAPFQLLTLDEQITGLGSKLRYRGERGPDAFKLLVDSGSGWRVVALAEPPRETFYDTVPGLSAPGRQVDADLAVGARYETTRFDVQLATNVVAKNHVASVSSVLLRGATQRVWTIDSTEESTGIRMSARVLDDGRLLEGNLGAQFRLAREDEVSAKDPRVDVLDLYERSLVPAKGQRISDPRRISSARYRVCGVEVALLAGPGQEASPEAGPGACSTLRVLKASDRQPALKLSPAEREGYLRSDARVTAADPTVKRAGEDALAGLDAGARRDGRRVARALVSWVHRHVRYSLDFNPPDAAQVLARGLGDCSEGALLLVAMARSLGLPAREVNGLVHAGAAGAQGFAYHAWAELFVDGAWLPVDPTWDEVPVNATHLRFDVQGPYGILGVFGRVTLEVLEAK